MGQEMKSILQFMYLGQATFYQDRMKEFLDVAKLLELKEISKDVDCDTVALKDQENDENIQLSEESVNDHENSISQSFILEETEQTFSRTTSFKNETGQYQCQKCDKQFSNYPNLYKHNKGAHEGKKYQCNMQSCFCPEFQS